MVTLPLGVQAVALSLNDKQLAWAAGDNETVRLSVQLDVIVRALAFSSDRSHLQTHRGLLSPFSPFTISLDQPFHQHMMVYS